MSYERQSLVYQLPFMESGQEMEWDYSFNPKHAWRLLLVWIRGSGFCYYYSRCLATLRIKENVP